METIETYKSEGQSPYKLIGLVFFASFTSLMFVSVAYGAFFGTESLQAQQVRLESDYERQTGIIERSVGQKEALHKQISLLDETIADATEVKWSTEYDLAKVKLQLELQKDKPNKEVRKRLSSKILELDNMYNDAFSTTPTEEGDVFTTE